MVYKSEGSIVGENGVMEGVRRGSVTRETKKEKKKDRY